MHGQSAIFCPGTLPNHVVCSQSRRLVALRVEAGADATTQKVKRLLCKSFLLIFFDSCASWTYRVLEEELNSTQPMLAGVISQFIPLPHPDPLPTLLSRNRKISIPKIHLVFPKSTLYHKP